MIEVDITFTVDPKDVRKLPDGSTLMTNATVIAQGRRSVRDVRLRVDGGVELGVAKELGHAMGHEPGDGPDEAPE